jgi:YebC/PmpR family DNA-binding regulatory protein
MSGHSKWHSIKHQKAATDAKRGQAFTRLTNNISAAAKQGGGDIEMNFRLRLAVETARAANMPKDNIERAIKRGTGELAGVTIEEFTMEAFAPGGAGLLISIITDNRNRALSDIRLILSKGGGTVAGQGAVSHMFEQRGVLRASTDLTDQLEEQIIDSGALDYSADDGILTIETDRTDLKKVKDALEEDGLKFETADLEFVPTTTAAIPDGKRDSLIGLMERLEDNDDVASVATNAEL